MTVLLCRNEAPWFEHGFAMGRLMIRCSHTFGYILFITSVLCHHSLPLAVLRISWVTCYNAIRVSLPTLGQIGKICRDGQRLDTSMPVGSSSRRLCLVRRAPHVFHRGYVNSCMFLWFSLPLVVRSCDTELQLLTISISLPSLVFHRMSIVVCWLYSFVNLFKKKIFPIWSLKR